jgi:hypothetical protein
VAANALFLFLLWGVKKDMTELKNRNAAGINGQVAPCIVPFCRNMSETQAITHCLRGKTGADEKGYRDTLSRSSTRLSCWVLFLF